MCIRDSTHTVMDNTDKRNYVLQVRYDERGAMEVPIPPWYSAARPGVGLAGSQATGGRIVSSSRRCRCR